MAGKAIYLSDNDAKLLRDLIARERQRYGGAPPLRSGDPPLPQAPEVYIALPSSSDGIPGLIPAEGTSTDIIPGVAECSIYQIIESAGTPYLVSAGFTREVYNLTEGVVKQDWIVIQRDKFGRWVTTGAPAEFIVGVTLNEDLGETTAGEAACNVRAVWNPSTESFESGSTGTGAEEGVFVDPENVFAGAVSGATGYARRMIGNDRTVYLGENLNCGPRTGT